MSVTSFLGGVVLVLGVALWVGNVSGAFRTFPLAGYLTIAAGGAILRAGRGSSSGPI